MYECLIPENVSTISQIKRFINPSNCLRAEIEKFCLTTSVHCASVKPKFHNHLSSPHQIIGTVLLAKMPTCLPVVPCHCCGTVI